MRRKGNGLNTILIIIILIIIILSLGKKNNTVSEEKTYKYDAAAIVVGNTANSPTPNFSNIDSFEEIIESVFYNTKTGKKPKVSIISATSSPTNIEIEDKYQVSPAANDAATEENLSLFIKGVNIAIASSPENAGSDYFEAIRLAAESVKTAKNPIIIIYGSGLSDSGIINFAFDNVLEKYDEDNKYITNLFKSNKKIEENIYYGLNAYWYGAGQVVSPQKELKEWAVTLKNIYYDALYYIGINVTFESIEVTSRTKSVETEYDVNETIVGTLSTGDEIDLNERYAEFYPDKSTLKNEDEVKEYLESFAKKIIKSDVKIKVTGYQTVCATTNKLGLARANKIADILVSLGVNRDNIEVAGVAGPPDDREESPRCGNTGVATEHRTVRITVK